MVQSDTLGDRDHAEVLQGDHQSSFQLPDRIWQRAEIVAEAVLADHRVVNPGAARLSKESQQDKLRSLPCPERAI